MTSYDQKIADFLTRYPQAEWGPAHVVLSDHNLEAFWIRQCLEAIDMTLVYERMLRPEAVEELKATHALLHDLLNDADRIRDEAGEGFH